MNRFLQKLAGPCHLRAPKLTLLLTWLVLITLLCLTVPAVNLVSAGGEAAILANSAQTDFPAKITFRLSAQNDTNITDIRLQYTVARVSHAQVVSESYISLKPASKIDVSWAWDMRKTGGMPAGTTISYWWVIKDSNGNKTITPPNQVSFDDTRYSWQVLTKDKVTLYWYKENDTFALELMDASLQALVKLAQSAGAVIERPVKIYIYADAQALRGAMINPQEWTGGVNFSDYSTIAIGISKSSLAWGKRAIAHELTHQVMFQMTNNPYGDLPTWLDEGFAMYGEGPLESQYQSILDRSVSRGNLISVRSLASPFSAISEISYLSYAESFSIVDFLIKTYGQQKMLTLLKTFQGGASYDGALLKVYGFDMDGLNRFLQQSLTPVKPTSAALPLLYPEFAAAWG